jgi:hypothetical protein
LNVCVYLFVLKTTGTKINNPDFRVQGMDKKDVFRFKVTVDDFLCLQQRESMKDLPGKPADQLDAKSSEIMGLNELIEVDP